MSSSIIAALSGVPPSAIGLLGGGGGNSVSTPTGAGGNAADQGYQGIGSRGAGGVVNPQGAQAANNIYGPWDSRNAAVGATPSAMGTAGIYRKSSKKK